MGYTFDDRVIVANLALDADGSSPPTDVRKYGPGFSIQAVLDADGGDAAGNLVLEGSNDKTNWIALAGTTQAFTNANTTLAWDPVVTKLHYVRVTVDATSGTGGTLSLLFNGAWTV